MKKIFAILIFLSAEIGFAQNIYNRTLKLMGSMFDLTVVAHGPIEGEQYLDQAVAEISRIENLISSWKESSQTSAINRNSGIRPVQVDAELFELIERSIGISKLTDGAFDISYASMDHIWKYDGSMAQMPTEKEIKESVAKVGHKNIVLDKAHSTVFLKHKGMKIGFGAIGKGYAADRAKELLIKNGAVAGIINASGDMSTWGRQPDGTEWRVAITNPIDSSKAYGLLPLSSGAVATSGNYEKYVTFNGVRYSHIIDPRTGMPASGLASVTVFAPKAELADALATSVFVMGKDIGLDRINQLPNIECIIIDGQGNIFTSNRIKIDTK